MKRHWLLAGIALALAACGRQEPAQPTGSAPGSAEPPVASTPVADKFTHSNYEDVRITDVDLDLDVNFDSRTLEGTATLALEYPNESARTLILDTDDLEIRGVEAHAGSWQPAEYALGADAAPLGAPLTIALPDGTDRVRVTYRTDPGAAGLQWLAPAQTAGKEHPFLFSQNQAIHARSMVPIQDTPAIRITYSATLRTPPDLLAVMSAEQDPEAVRDGEYHFRMPQPIPPYLIALAVGDIAFEPIDDDIGVYAEPSVVAAAAREFEDTPKMEAANIALYGPYRWGRYDMIVLPPSFPFGGMENPRLTFLTPTLLAGDKSLTNVVAHELAHSWSGNLVTNATWRDAWMNEGFTTYVENRVMEALYGEDRATMERALDLANLRKDVAKAERPELTQLKMPADLSHPDDAFSDVSYVKGAFFLKFLEKRFGRSTFDEFLRGYFDHFAFQSITTEDFKAYLEQHLLPRDPEAVTGEEIDTWLYGQGIPDLIEQPDSQAFERVTEWQARWLAGEVTAREIPTAAWTTHEWLHFINTLPGGLDADRLAALDAAFDLTHRGNAEIAFAWYMQAIKAGYEPALPAIDAFLMRVGRGKFIYDLYEALRDNGRVELAKEIYARARPGYHPIAQRRIDEILSG
jgi:leukotriene-A4 hydrolase